MKKVITLALSIILCVCMLTACGGAKPEPSPSPSPEATQKADSTDGEEEYVEAMEDYIAGVEEYVEALGILIEGADSLGDEAEIVEWCETFDTIKEDLSDAADELAAAMADVPEGYEESHAKITIAVAAICDAMTGFEDAVVAAIEGDQSAFEDGLVEFLGNMTAADELWADAVEK